MAVGAGEVGDVGGERPDDGGGHVVDVHERAQLGVLRPHAGKRRLIEDHHRAQDDRGDPRAAEHHRADV